MTAETLEEFNLTLKPNKRRTRKPKPMTGCSEKRAEEGGDDFQTPPEALSVLYPYLPAGKTIWEPAMGEGNLVSALMKRGYPVIGSDIKTGQNFFSYRPADPWDIQVTNPPFSVKDGWIAESYRWLVEYGKPFALLLPFAALEGAKRQPLYIQHGVELIFLDRRLNFQTPSGEGDGSWFATMWLTAGLNIGRQLTFATVEDEKQAD